MQIKYEAVYFSYNENTEFQVDALKDVNLFLNDNNITAIVGKTGSGKSTLIEMMNYFITPSKGSIKVDDFVNEKKYKHRHRDIQNMRRKIGFLFQFSENQLFEETVIKDISFGIRNFYPKNEEYLADAEEALNFVGLDKSFASRSPFDLSGGEKKRAAIAGVISYKPDLLILDEPTAGLDAKGKKEIMDLFKKIHERGVAIILVTHDMDVVLEYADKMIIVDEGKIAKVGTPKEILKEDVEKYNLETPNIYKLIHALKTRGIKINDSVCDINGLVKELKNHG